MFFCGGVAKVFLDGFGWRVHCLESLLESVVGCSYPGLVDRADLYHVRKIATIRFFSVARLRLVASLCSSCRSL